jgi:cation transport regulator ChaC
MHRLLYFAYGSNLWPPRLRARTASSNPLYRAVLAGHRFCFHKLGRDGSAKCDAYFTGEKQHRVEGVVYALLDRERPALDRAEDLGRGYEAYRVEVESDAGLIEVFTYRARTEMIIPGAKPFSWYREFVLRGAHYHGLSNAYIGRIRQQSVVTDPDSARAARNYAMLDLVSPPDVN